MIKLKNKIKMLGREFQKNFEFFFLNSLQHTPMGMLGMFIRSNREGISGLDGISGGISYQTPQKDFLHTHKKKRKGGQAIPWKRINGH